MKKYLTMAIIASILMIMNCDPAPDEVSSCIYLIDNNKAKSICLDAFMITDTCPMVSTQAGNENDILVAAKVDPAFTTNSAGINTLGSCTDTFPIQCTVSTGTINAGQTVYAVSQADCDVYIK